MEAQESASNPNARAIVAATETTRSLNEYEGLTESSLIQRSFEADRRGEPVGAAERREAGAEVHPVEAGPARQEHLVAPQAGGPGLDLLAEVDAVDRVEVVRGLERTEALLADRERLDVVPGAADPALERRRARDRGRHPVTAP